MNASVEDLRKVMASKSDADLYDVVYGHPNDYTPEAVRIATQEFNSRNWNAVDESRVRATIDKQKCVEEAGLEWHLRIIAFFISTAALGIPVILAHRHYIERGAKRKAREWAQWSLFGFVFFLAVALLRFIL